MKTQKHSTPSKPLLSSTLLLFLVSAGLAAAAPPSSVTNHRLVNAYGEPAGLGNVPDVIIPDTKAMNQSNSRPGIGGLYLMKGSFDRRNFESLGSWQERVAMESRGTVIIGPLEVLDSGPTGPMTPDTRAAATDEVTTQVLDRIRTTDKIMSSLKTRSQTREPDAQVGFKATASEVAERRQVLREDLKTMRAANDDEWSNARTAVSVSFNAYVQSTHRAEELASSS